MVRRVAVIVAAVLAMGAVPHALRRLPPRVVWTRALSADLDGDGKADAIFTARDDAYYYVAVLTRGASRASYVRFGLSGDAQDALCDEPGALVTESLDVDVSQMLGSQPEGWRRTRRGKGLLLRGGDCDPFHLYWNHARAALDWWRL